MPLNVLLKGREVAYHLADSDAKAYFCFEGTPELPMGRAGYAGLRAGRRLRALLRDHRRPGRPLADRGRRDDRRRRWPRQPADVRHGRRPTRTTRRSSSTPPARPGQPKGAELRHRNMRDNALVGAEPFGAEPTAPTPTSCVLPLFHSFGQTVIQNAAFAFGGTVVHAAALRGQAGARADGRRRRSPSSPACRRCTGACSARWMHGVDVDAIAGEPPGRALPAARRCRSRSTRTFEERFGVTILEGYGLSETSPVATFSEYGEPARSARSACRSPASR